MGNYQPREYICHSIRWVGRQKIVTLVPGNIEITLPLSACIGKKDTLVFDGIFLKVKCKNGFAQLLPTYLSTDILRFGGRDLDIIVKEITTDEEQIGYESLADNHYRSSIPAGRHSRLIARSYHPLHPTILGYIELQTSFYMNKARTRFFDAPFSDGDLEVVKWAKWNQAARQQYTNAIVRISRCVIHPEFRGLGLGKRLVEHAERFAKVHWHSGGLRPLFLEISADMLKYVPFAERAGMTYMGDSEGNLHRVYRDMRYLIGNVDRVHKGEVARKDSIAIVREQVNRMERALELIKEEGVTTEAFLALLQNLTEQSTLQDYSRLHKIVRLPKPTFIKGLTTEASAFVTERANNLNQPRNNIEPDWHTDLINNPISVCNVTLTYVSEVNRTIETSAVQQAFNISPDQIVSTHIRRLSFEVEPGEIWIITGPSGSGKTTLLQRFLLSQLPKHLRQEGEIIPPSNYSPSQFDEISSQEPLINAFGLNDVSTALHLMGLVGLSDAYIYLKRYSELSKGQQFRAQLAKLIISRANVWLVDEFCSNLDPITASVVADKFQRVARALRATVIVAAPHVESFIFSLRPDRVLQLTSTWEYRMFSGREYIEAVERGIAHPKYVPVFDLPPQILKQIITGKVLQIIYISNFDYSVYPGLSIVLSDGARQISVNVESVESRRVAELTLTDAKAAGYSTVSRLIKGIQAESVQNISILKFKNLNVSAFYNNVT